jgi:hypothetical protein
LTEPCLLVEDEAFMVHEEGVLSRRVGIEDLPGLI